MMELAAETGIAATCTTVAPTGRESHTTGTSSGREPPPRLVPAVCGIPSSGAHPPRR